MGSDMTHARRRPYPPAQEAYSDACYWWLPRPERIALACRDTHPGMGEEALVIETALALSTSYSEASPQLLRRVAVAALEKTRGILDHINGKVTRYDGR